MLAATERVMTRGWYILGEELEIFEREFAAYTGKKYAVGVGTGLDALALALKAQGIGPGDKVLVPDFTFIATWLAVSLIGAEPIPVRVCTETANLDPNALPHAPEAGTKAIVPVHLYGNPADMISVRSYADQHSLSVIADSAQAHGAQIRSECVDSLADAASYSFYPGKNLGALGDGGAVVTDDFDYAQRIRQLRNYGSRIKYIHDTLGDNSRLDELQAAYLSIRLKTLDRDNQRRRLQAERYDLAFCRFSKEIRPIQPLSGTLSSRHLYVIRVPDRERLQRRLKDRAIETQIHYPVLPGDQKAYVGTRAASLSADNPSRNLADEVLSLPIGPHLNDEQIDHVASSLVRLLS